MCNNFIAPILQTRKLRHRGLKRLVQVPIIRKWLSQNLNPSLLQIPGSSSPKWNLLLFPTLQEK